MTAIACDRRVAHRALYVVRACAACMLLAVLLLRVPPTFGGEDPTSADVLVRQAAEYQAEAPKTVLELQQFRRSESVVAGGAGGRAGTATLVNLNPRVNAWFLLTVDWGERGGRSTYHLENPRPRAQVIRLAEAGSEGVRISVADRTTACDLWSGGAASVLEAAKRAGLAYAPLCDGRLYLRNRVRGNQTSLERATDFLRDHVWGGEAIVGFVREEFYRDRYIEKGVAGTMVPIAGQIEDPDSPRPAALADEPGGQILVPHDLGIDLGRPATSLVPGRWYAVSGLSGIHLSFVQPRGIGQNIAAADRGTVNPLDSVEADALAYFVAFDLAKFDLGFALGTDHPRVGWSERILDAARDASLPGPDGINSVSPLVTNGMVAPALTLNTVATFAGGFKRQHGAFRYGAFAQQNHGSHYGFVEQGAVLSRLVPGLSTLYVLDDGSVGMKTWSRQDDGLLSRIRHARQNGVALIEHDPATGISRPGPLVVRWGPGNWSGTAEEKLRSLRSGLCLQQTAARRFLIYGYFSSATPSTMARVFQAYGCQYAMHLDMNALEHTYLALYLRRGAEVVVEHLVQGMAQVDKKAGSGVIPRFLGFPDDRDFFYLTRREGSS
jgi:hypothetical protein